MVHLMLANIQVKENILTDEKYKFLFSVEEVNKLVLGGVPFRDAYKQVGSAIEQGEFKYSTQIKHTHEGSIGNLSNDRITAMMDAVLAKFQFERVDQALKVLLH